MPLHSASAIAVAAAVWLHFHIHTGGGVAGHKHSLQVSIQSSQPLPQAALKAAVHYTLTQSYISVDAVQDGGYG